MASQHIIQDICRYLKNQPMTACLTVTSVEAGVTDSAFCTFTEGFVSVTTSVFDASSDGLQSPFPDGFSYSDEVYN